MVVIGVDSSGHVKNPPIYLIAVRRSKRKGQMTRSVYISREKHEEYVNYSLRMKIEHWFEKISAILIFKAIIGIYYPGDSINIDTDFQGRSRRYVKEYLGRLFLEKYWGDSKRNNPSITFTSVRHDEIVKEADIKSKKLRRGYIRIDIEDPNIKKELLILKKY